MIDKNDPKLTAFALGELTDAELSEIMADVNSSAELQAEVEAIKQVANEVGEILMAEPYIDIIVDCPHKINTTAAKTVGLGYYAIGIASAVVIVCVIFVTIIIQSLDKDKIAAVQKNTPPTPDVKIETATLESERKETMPTLEISDADQSGRSADSITDQNDNTDTNRIKISTDNSGDNNNKINDFLISENTKKKSPPLLNAPLPHPNSNSSRSFNPQNSNLNSDSNLNSNVPIVIDADSYNNGQNLFGSLDLREQNRTQNQIFLSDSNRFNKQQGTVRNSGENNTVSGNDIAPEKKSAMNDNFETRDNKFDFGSSSGSVTLGKIDSVENLSAYSVMRQLINDGKLPLASEIKIGEYINNFRYNYSGIKNDQRFAVQADVIQCPWNANHLLARVGIKRLANKISRAKISTQKNHSVSGAGKTANTERNDGRLQVAVKFDESKIKSYSPINNIGLELVADRSGAKELEKNKKETENFAMVEICDVGAKVDQNGEMTLLYEIIPAMQIQNHAGINDKISGQQNLRVNDYFSVELNSGDLYPATATKQTTANANESENNTAESNSNKINDEITGETQFAAAVALYGLLLQKGGVMENCDWNTVKNLAIPNIKNNEQRKEFLKLIEKASTLTPQSNKKK
ncbi:MAG: von Willebrand factor type A domain-containing protein [Planctomycetaceae bacterium]|jgi:hypothetical protein|nr:von Willebrand factor type A domain-containing protein [Planctomycetaceae bacterium]